MALLTVATVTLVSMEPDLVGPGQYPPPRDGWNSGLLSEIVKELRAFR